MGITKGSGPQGLPVINGTEPSIKTLKSVPEDADNSLIQEAPMNQNQNEKNHSVRRIVLPSGRSIEVVRFEEESIARPTTGLHICPMCECELVQPVEWGEASADRWGLTLHCPNCDWLSHGTYDHEQVMALEEELDEGLAAVLRDLKRLADANIADEIERFAAALDADLILPEDF